MSSKIKMFNLNKQHILLIRIIEKYIYIKKPNNITIWSNKVSNQ